MVMFAHEREKALLDLLGRRQRLTAREIERVLHISPATVRRQLAALERRGELVRVHGGVLHPEAVHGEPIFQRRLSEQVVAKAAIAARANELVKSGAVIYLDAGSTTLALARRLITRRELTIVTHSIPVLTLAHTGSAKVVGVGGEVRPPSQALIGALALSWLDHLHFDWVFVGASGLDATRGAGITTLAEAAVKQAAMNRAERRALLCDRSKWDIVAPVYFAGWDAFDVWITDGPIRRRPKGHGHTRRPNIIVAQPIGSGK